MVAVLNIPTDQEIDEHTDDHETRLELRGLAEYQRQQAQMISISRRDLDFELGEQSRKLFAAEALVETVVEALQARFSQDWPADVPDYRRVLRSAASEIRSAYENLEVLTLEHNAEKRAKGGES